MEAGPAVAEQGQVNPGAVEPWIQRNQTAVRTEPFGLCLERKCSGRHFRIACRFLGASLAAAMLPFTVNFKVSARTLTGALNAHNKAAVDW